MWNVKTLRPLKWARNFGIGRRLILASLISAVLIISTIFVGSIPLNARTVQIDSNGSWPYFKITTESTYIRAWYSIRRYTYNSIPVTNLTIEGEIEMFVMNLTKVEDGRLLNIFAPNVLANELTLYTTRLTFSIFDIVGSPTQEFRLPPSEDPYASMYIEAVFLNTSSMTLNGMELNVSTFS